MHFFKFLDSLQNDCFKTNLWYPGNDIGGKGIVGWDIYKCRDKCNGKDDCKGIEYNPEGVCFLKSKFVLHDKEKPGLISWKKSCSGKWFDSLSTSCNPTTTDIHAYTADQNATSVMAVGH